MKTQQIIENYCHLYGVDFPEMDMQENRYFVTISDSGSGVLYLHRSSKILGQIIGAAMKRGTVLYVCHNRVIPITWENWKKIWSELFAPKVRDRNPEPNYLHPYKWHDFEELQQKDVYRKPRKRGFERNFFANQAMNLLTPTLVPKTKI